jgi:hypothetical protein
MMTAALFGCGIPHFVSFAGYQSLYKLPHKGNAPVAISPQSRLPPYFQLEQAP